ncbi:gamma-glutamyl-gamma-aminobutyrate hydrolase family protein [Flintibacter porci]|uniref:gamma-glutamyl-gamma-aminobutyrate hydrolase family protein n=1 Tax=Flintibacter porci TaxID=3342383 RepID=UPI003F898BB7
MSSQKYQGENHIPKVQISGQAGGLERYIRAVERAGAIPVPGICSIPDPSCDALVLCGGGDMDPVLFGQENWGSNPPDRERDRAELALAEAFLTWERPVLGICRGMQVLNVFLGGTLIQDLQPAWRVRHQGEEDVYHPIRCQPGSLLERLLGPSPVVNSAHHQAVDLLGHDLTATAWAPEGFTEGIEHSCLPVLGVQFHPERLSGLGRGEGSALFQWLISCIEA